MCFFRVVFTATGLIICPVIKTSKTTTDLYTPVQFLTLIHSSLLYYIPSFLSSFRPSFLTLFLPNYFYFFFLLPCSLLSYPFFLIFSCFLPSSFFILPSVLPSFLPSFLPSLFVCLFLAILLLSLLFNTPFFLPSSFHPLLLLFFIFSFHPCPFFYLVFHATFTFSRKKTIFPAFSGKKKKDFF